MRALAAGFCVVAVAAALEARQVVFRAGVDLVTLGVTVTDRRGTLVTDLTRDDFEILEDGVPQRIASFAPGLPGAASQDGWDLMAPLHPALMLDTSASMERELHVARSAAIKFLNALPPHEDVTLVDFDTEVRVTRYPPSEFPRIVERIRMRDAEGWTALYDALGVYLDGAATQDGRPILVMYTDGADSRSNLSLGEALDLLKASAVTVYAIGLTEAGSRARLEARRTLQLLTETTGGQVYFPSSLDDLDAVYAKILDEIRAQYQVGYQSTNSVADGRWRKVEIRLKRPDLRVRARQGYFALYRPPPAP